MNNLRIKAGQDAYGLIRDGGFHWDKVSAYFAPAGGPRWLVASGFDLTLLQSGLLGQKKPALLIGSSAGAWRLAAWLQPQAADAYRRLIMAYIAMPYGRNDSPSVVKESLLGVINDYLPEDALSFALNNKQYRLAVITARTRNLLASEVKFIQQTGLGLCFLLNCFSRSQLYHFFERVVFYMGAKPPDFCLSRGFQGRYVVLNEVNFRHAILASAAIPLIVAGVKDIYGAPSGIYRDGGLLDYHLTQRYSLSREEITLFFHQQEHIIPGWLDKRLKSRKPTPEVLQNVLMVYPTQEFTASLPGGRIPDRTDFLTFLNDPRQRMANWQQTVDLAAHLGEEFLELVESGRIRDKLEKLSE